MNPRFDALLITSFGGPEGEKDVLPFLDNVLRGKNVPEERKKEVAKNYALFNGVSPLNAQNRELQQKLQKEFKFPVYWGNRNWKPYLAETLLQMKRDGIQYALTFITSAYSSYSGCRQYLEDIENARLEVGEGAPAIERLSLFYDHPLFIEVHCENIRKLIKPESYLLFTAHSIPLSMSDHCDYLKQLKQVSNRISSELQVKNFSLVFQSRSGPPSQPWLEPDLYSALTEIKEKGFREIVLSPIGFVSDHMEVIYDLDVMAQEQAKALGINLFRAGTPGNHPKFVQMIVDLVHQRMNGEKLKTCQVGCCPKS